MMQSLPSAPQGVLTNVGGVPGLHAVLFLDSGMWVAQCLEYDIATQTRTRDDIAEAIDFVIHAHILVSSELGQPPFHNVPPAPDIFWSALA